MNIKRINKSSIVKAVVVIGIVLIPLMYSFFYLNAFWDPYARLNELPVAVVNNDKGTSINNEERNLGNEVCEKLKENDSIKFIFTDYADARAGTEEKGYYAMIVFPEDFSSSIASASEKEKNRAEIIFSPNEKKNYLAGQILSRAVLELEKNTREAVTEELVQTLTEQINGVPGKMNELQEGFEKLSVGADSIVEGSNVLATGTADFATNFSLYAKGIISLKAGIGELSNGATRLSTGAKDLNTGITAYTLGVDNLIKTVNDTSAFISGYVKSHPELLKDPTFVAFIQNMSSPENAKSIEALSLAGMKLKAGATQLVGGSTAVVKGSSVLNQGVNKVDSATTKLTKASEQIAEGTVKLDDGISELSKGINQAKQEVTNSISNAKQQLSTLDGLSEFASKPVDVVTEIINPIPNYGTYFSPYFMSLSLWVGALIIFFGIYYDADNRFKILSRNSDKKIARSFIYLLIGFAQAIVLAIVLKTGLGLDVKNNGLYITSVCLVSLVFITIVQFCIVHTGDLGKFLSIALLILQLTSCGGTFPMETVPKFFNILYPFMPMTYSVALFKDAITGSITNSTWANLGVLTGILVVFFITTIVLSTFKKNKLSTAKISN